ncbi:NB-ARC domain-containing protein [Prauserella shujinwangii]|nr:NB-ARC domain-containing protein [Prauserella shujinwangii]
MEAARRELPGTVTEPQPWPRPMQLPAGPVVFVGRSAELARMDRLLTEREIPAGSVPILTVEGPAGVGKTALALRWARQHLDDFDDGALFADLHGSDATRHPTDPGEVLDGFLRALGVRPDRIPDNTEQRESLFRSALAGRRMLVVLDDVASSDQVNPVLPGSADCHVLVTSRRRLTGLTVVSDAVSLTLGQLGRGESIDLMTAIIGEQRAAQDPAAVAAIIRRCSRLPLDLRVVAEHITALPQTPLAAFVDEWTAVNQRFPNSQRGHQNKLTE